MSTQRAISMQLLLKFKVSLKAKFSGYLELKIIKERNNALIYKSDH